MASIAFFANTDWYLYNFRRSLALAVREGGDEVLLLSPPGPYVERLKKLGFRWESVPMQRRSLNPLRELVLLLYLARLFRRERLDMVHGFTIKGAIYCSVAARISRVPKIISAVAGLGYVFTSHDIKARLLRPLVTALMRWSLNGSNARLILQNPDDFAFFRNRGIVEPARIRMIPGSGVDCNRFFPKTATNEGAAMRVLLPARLLWDKGLTEYIEAARSLVGSGRDIAFLLAGSVDHGNPGAAPEATVRQWVSEGLIDWLGHVDDMAVLLQSVDVVALPSRYGEGLPKSLIEAAACGCALVTTDMPGCRDVVSEGVDGLIVPVGDARALADAIVHLYDEPSLRLRLGKAARQKVLKLFDERIVISRTLEVYRELFDR